MMSGNNNSGSPTSNLFPSITSLFQSPIGTPRVTPTPQHLAAYFFNEDQFHSLIFPNSSLSNSNDLSNMITNFTNGELSNNLSPLPLFNNLISSSSMVGTTNGTNNQQNTGQAPSNTGAQDSTTKLPNSSNEITNDPPALHTPKNNLLSANN